MKKKLTKIAGIVLIISLLLNGVLIYQNLTYSKVYKEHTQTIESLTGNASYYATKDLGYLSDVAYGYSNYLNRIAKGDAIVDDLINYVQGITERDEWPEALYAVYFESAEPKIKKELINLVRDCYNAVHIENKKDILAQMNDKQLQTLAGYYDDMEQLLNANKKNNLIKYFDNADYTSNNSYQAQSKLRYVLTCIQDLLNVKNYAASSGAESSQLAADTTQPMQIEGKFVAKVRAVLPDYVLDDTTPRNIVVTTFQSGPFLINVGALADDLEIGEIYSFEVTPKKLGTYKPSELDNTVLSPEKAVPLYNLRIERIHDATEEAYSQDGAQLQYTAIQ